ncbi:MAG: glycosyltransferase family 4 protein, partial [Saprospiraceae bacterium]
MKILLVCNSQIPISTYEDAGRVAWWLGKELTKRGHEVTFLAKKGSVCPFASVIIWDDKKPLETQLPPGTELIHFHCPTKETPEIPYLITCYENSTEPCIFDRNTVFLSAKHAQLHGGTVYVQPGLDFCDYGQPNLDGKRPYYHFLGNAAWS